jgi:hypothetical protein
VTSSPRLLCRIEPLEQEAQGRLEALEVIGVTVIGRDEPRLHAERIDLPREALRRSRPSIAARPEEPMPISNDAFRRGDVYIDYPFEDVRFRFEKATGKVYRRFYGCAEDEVRPDSDLYHQAILSGREITRDEYDAD